VPTKVGKGTARRAFLAARKKATVEEILAGLPAFVAYEERRRGEADYKPLHPATWLNAERWTDEAPAPATNGRRKVAPGFPPGHPAHGREPGAKFEHEGRWYWLRPDGVLMAKDPAAPRGMVRID
jgi:hypothetical protein